jgi:hypothetical protein
VATLIILVVLVLNITRLVVGRHANFFFHIGVLVVVAVVLGLVAAFTVDRKLDERERR